MVIMTLDELKRLSLPDTPGVYRFMGKGQQVLYIGKATSLKDRVRSYFSATVATRGRHIEEMVRDARTVAWDETDSVLDALVLESALIKRFHPPANTKEKDNKSFNYLVITKEDYPRVLVIRERTWLKDAEARTRKLKAVFGPFPSGVQLEIGLRLIRTIFPFRDTCKPLSGKLCFNAQLGLCPGVCDDRMSKKDYQRTIAHITTFFSGKKKVLLGSLKKEMDKAAIELRFEDAGRIKKTIFSLMHLNDVALIRDDVRGASKEASGLSEGVMRIEAYDVAHMGGKAGVGVMVVVENGVAAPAEYRKFKLRGAGKDKSDDPLNLREILERRFGHIEWPLPNLIVVDGNEVQIRVAEAVVKEKGYSIPVASVVKDDRHRAREILGSMHDGAKDTEKAILLANSEAHRFSITYHRKLLRRSLLPGTRPKK
jgi:excinuclease ABC subunit C